MLFVVVRDVGDRFGGCGHRGGECEEKSSIIFKFNTWYCDEPGSPDSECKPYITDKSHIRIMEEINDLIFVDCSWQQQQQQFCLVERLEGGRFCRWKLDNSKIIWFLNYIPSWHLVLWWTTVNLNLTTQMKVEFELIEGYNYFDCHCLFLKSKGRQICWVGTGRWGEGLWFYQNLGDVKIIEVNTWYCDELGSPDGEC